MIVKYKMYDFIIYCKIIDEKSAYGVKRYLITPVSGSGKKWTTKVPGKDMEIIEEIIKR